MQPPLTDVEVRVLGALLEKEATTPDNYPLSLNALVAACNQTTNREPVMRLDEDTVMAAAVALRRRYLLRQIQPAGSRVTKFEHLLAQELKLDGRELAVLGVLMLRGAADAGRAVHTYGAARVVRRPRRPGGGAGIADGAGAGTVRGTSFPSHRAEGSPLRTPAERRAAGRGAGRGDEPAAPTRRTRVRRKTGSR